MKTDKRVADLCAEYEKATGNIATPAIKNFICSFYAVCDRFLEKGREDGAAGKVTPLSVVFLDWAKKSVDDEDKARTIAMFIEDAYRDGYRGGQMQTEATK